VLEECFSDTLVLYWGQNPVWIKTLVGEMTCHVNDPTTQMSVPQKHTSDNGVTLLTQRNYSIYFLFCPRMEDWSFPFPPSTESKNGKVTSPLDAIALKNTAQYIILQSFNIEKMISRDMATEL
jgi:hypothetical protein